MNPHSNESVVELDLRRYMRAVRRSKKLVIFSTVLAIGVAYLFLQLRPAASAVDDVVDLEPYRSSVTVRIETSPVQLPSNAAVDVLGIGWNTRRNFQSHVDLMRSLNVMSRAEQALNEAAQGDFASGDAAGSGPPADVVDLSQYITVRGATGTDLVEVIAEGETEEVAQARASAVVNAYKEFLREEQYGTVQEALDTIDEQLAEIRERTLITPEIADVLNRVSDELASVRRTVESGSGELSAKSAQITAQIRESVGISSVAGSGDATLDTLVASAEVLEYAIGRLDAISQESRRAELHHALSTQVAALSEGAVILGQAVAELDSLIVEVLLSTASPPTSPTASPTASPATQAAEQLRWVAQRLTAISEASDAIAGGVRARQDSGIADESDMRLLSEQIGSTNGILQGVVSSIAAVRQTQSSGSIFAQLIVAEERIKHVGLEITNARVLTGSSIDATESRLVETRGDLASALYVTRQLILRAEAAGPGRDVEGVTRQTVLAQVSEVSRQLSNASGTLAKVRRSDVQGTDTFDVLGVESRLTGYSGGLSAIAALASLGDSLDRIDEQARLTGVMASELNESTPLAEARDALAEIGIGLTVASNALTNVSAGVRQLQERDALSDDSDLLLVAQRAQSAGTRLLSIANRVPRLEEASSTETVRLVTVQRELELLLLRPQHTNVSTIDSSVIRPATVAVQAPDDGLDLRFILGGFAGLLVGILGAVVSESFNRRIWDVDDARMIPGLVPVGAITRGRTKGKGGKRPPEVTDRPLGAFGESVHSVAGRLEQDIQSGARSMFITSPRNGEGKTVLALNLAQVLSMRGKSVVLVDANLRKPDSTELMEAVDKPGLCAVLEGSMNEAQALVQKEKFDFLPAGHSQFPPAELLGRPRMNVLIDSLEKSYDIVIVDGPPTVGFADAVDLGRQTDLTILVTRSGASSLSDLQEAHEILSNSGTGRLGVVANFSDTAAFRRMPRGYSDSTRSGSKIPEVRGTPNTSSVQG